MGGRVHDLGRGETEFFAAQAQALAERDHNDVAALTAVNPAAFEQSHVAGNDIDESFGSL